MRKLALLLVAIAITLPAAAATAQRREKNKGKPEFLRGMCFCSSTAGALSEKTIATWVKKNRVNLVAIDFFGVAFNYDHTNFGKIARLIKRLKRNAVTVLADYRPSTSPPGKGHRGPAPDLCLSNPEVRANIIGWGILILDRCPGIDILTLYNPLPRFERNKDCPNCKKQGEQKLLKAFFEEWAAAIRKKHPKVKLGAVFPAGMSLYRSLRPSIDVFCPFCSVIAPAGQASAGPGIMKKLAGQMRPLRKHGPVIPLVKLYWKQATRNTTEDILHVMDEAKRHGTDGFFLWYYTLLTGELDRMTRSFKLPEYDLKRIEEKFRELAGERPRQKRK